MFRSEECRFGKTTNSRLCVLNIVILPLEKLGVKSQDSRFGCCVRWYVVFAHGFVDPLPLLAQPGHDYMVHVIAFGSHVDYLVK